MTSKHLYIIGNGFDLRHSIPSGYSDFCSWLRRYHPTQSFSMDIMFNQHNDLWSNFEQALGNYNLKDAISGFFTPMIIEPFTRLNTRLDFSIIQSLGYDDIVRLFCEWISSINITEVKPLLSLQDNSYYLTFNYTFTLEQIYGIDPNNICHIHGVADNSESIIFGHNNYVDIESVLGAPQSSLEWINQSNRLFEMNLLFKDVNQIIAKTECLKKYEGMNMITVLGHSLNSVDKEYFHKLVLQNPKAKWVVDYKPSNPMEFERKSAFLTELGAKSVERFRS